MLKLNRCCWLLAGVVLLAGACGTPKPAEPVKEYVLKGVVLRMDSQVRTAVIKHEKIEGWMEPMTMEFPIRDAKEYEKLAVGKRIAGTVFVAGDEYWLGAITEAPAETPAAKPVPDAK